MMANTHMAIGVLAGIVLSNFFNFNPFVFIALAALGSLLPDVDHKNSTINRIFPITKIVPSFFEHRGFFHSVFPVLLLLFAFNFSGILSLGIPIAVGYLSHLLSDCLTRLGCNLLYPLSRLRVKGFIVTGGTFEMVLFVLVSLLDVVLFSRIV